MIFERTSNSWLPIGILVVLTATSFWLKGVVESTQHGSKNALRHDPDLIVYSFLAHQLGTNGKLRQTLGANKMLHYADDDSSVYENVVLSSFDEGQPPMNIRADQGERFKDSEEVLFTGHVVLTRQGSKPDDPPSILKTDRLQIFPNSKKGLTPGPVTIDHGPDHLEADNMTFDYTISKSEFNRAHVFFAPRHH